MTYFLQLRFMLQEVLNVIMVLHTLIFIVKVSKAKFKGLRVMKKTHTTTKVLNKKTAESCNNKATYKFQISTLFFSFIDDAKVTDFQYKETENLKTCDLKTKAKGVLTV